MNELIRKLGDEVKNKKMTWQEVADKVNQEYDTELTREAVRKRYNRIIKNKNKPIEINKQGEYETCMVTELLTQDSKLITTKKQVPI